jgi:hypothetical protein
MHTTLKGLRIECVQDFACYELNYASGGHTKDKSSLIIAIMQCNVTFSVSFYTQAGCWQPTAGNKLQ